MYDNNKFIVIATFRCLIPIEKDWYKKSQNIYN